MIQTITNKQIVEASKESPAMEAALKKLFPSAFDSEPLSAHFLIDEMRSHNSNVIYIRTFGEYNQKGLWLNKESYKWEILTDSEGELVLVGRKKAIV